MLCFHLKTFAHGPSGAGRKLDAPLSFPLRGLDMQPYLSTAVLSQRYRLPAGATRPPAPLLYDCACVVVHKGNLQGGHYVAYVRQADAWYLCDDAYVQRVAEHVVQQSQPYMLFYQQRNNDVV